MSLPIINHRSEWKDSAMPTAQQLRTAVANISLALETVDDLLSRVTPAPYEVLPDEIKVYVEIIKKNHHHMECLVAALLNINEAEGIYESMSAASLHNGILAMAEEHCV